jgi:hypothetical protein
MSNLVEKQSEPDFAIVINDLKSEVEKLAENADRIFNRLCVIRDIREPQPEALNKTTEESGVIGELNNLVREIRRQNGILNDAKRGLIRFVG